MPTGVYVRTEEMNEKTRQSTLGKNKGKVHTKEHKEKQRQKMLGKHHTEETKLKMKLSKIKSFQEYPEQKEKMSKAKVGKKYALGYRHSQEQKESKRQGQIKRYSDPLEREKQRQRCIGRIPSPKVSHGIKTYYNSPIQGEVCFRSSYELKYAQYLDSIGEIWFYEAGAFEMNINGRDTTYRPDFSLPLRREFIEIKGRKNYNSWEDCDAKLKSDTFKEELENEDLMGIFGYKVLFYEDLKKLGVNI